jgi:hypothetical protein
VLFISPAIAWSCSLLLLPEAAVAATALSTRWLSSCSRAALSSGLVLLGGTARLWYSRTHRTQQRGVNVGCLVPVSSCKMHECAACLVD